MNFICELNDDQYSYDYIDHIRNVARAIVINDKNEIALIHVFGDDIFGHRDYFETPGGGVKENELLEDAVLREILEEIGYKCKIESPIGWIKDISFHPIDEAISLYENMQNELVGKLVKQRELPLLLMVKNYLYKKDKK